MRPRLTVDWMFPDLLNLYGDRGNLMALDRLGRETGQEVVINRVDSVDQPLPADLAVFGSGDLDTIAMLATKKRQALLAFLEGCRRILVFGTTVSLFAQTTARPHHPDIPGLGLLPARASERTVDLAHPTQPFGDDFLLELDPASPCFRAGHAQLGGFYIKTLAVELEAGVEPFATVRYGLDNTATRLHQGFDGAWTDKIVWTNLLGPALVRNPWLALALLEGPAGQGQAVSPELEDSWDLERQSLAAVTAFAQTKR